MAEHVASKRALVAYEYNDGGGNSIRLESFDDTSTVTVVCGQCGHNYSFHRRPMYDVIRFIREAFKGKSKAGLYGDFVIETDWAIGQVVATLKKKGLYENTLIIVTSDNGSSPHGFPIQEEQVTHFCGHGKRRNRTFGTRKFEQRRLGGHVVIPDVMVHGLEPPYDFSRRSAQGNH